MGELSRLMGGGHLLLAYRLFGVCVAAGFVLVADRWLQRLGLGDRDRLARAPPRRPRRRHGRPLFNEGLGPLALPITGRGLTECLDLFTGFFPFVGFLTNPHFTAGTTLLLLGLLLYETADGLWGLALATLVATALALVRPYDFVLLVLVRGMAVLLVEPARLWRARLSPLLALLPVTGYLYWLFYRNPAFAFYSGTAYVFPALTDFLWALGPATILALVGAFAGTPDERGHRARMHLALWAGLAGLVIVARPVGFSLQFLVGMGFPLLALGALGLARLRPLVTLLATCVFALTFTVALRLHAHGPRPSGSRGGTPWPWWIGCAATAGKGDILFAPPDVGLFAYGLTPCRSFLSHRISPGYDQRLREWERFPQRAPRGAPCPPRRATASVTSSSPGIPRPGSPPGSGPSPGGRRLRGFASPARLGLYTRP